MTTEAPGPVWYVRLSKMTRFGPAALFLSVSVSLFLFTMWMQAGFSFALTLPEFFKGASTPLGNGLLIGYVIAVVNLVLPRAQRHLDDVRPHLDLSDNAFADARHSLIADPQRRLWVIAGACIPFSLLVNYLEGNFVYRLIHETEPATLYMVWRTVYQYLTWCCLLQVSYLFVRNARLFDLLGEQHGKINLLQVHRFAPFFQAGLDNALLILGGWLIPPLVFLLTGEGFAPQTVAFGLVVFGFATAYVVLVPTRGVREKIIALRRSELETVDRRIAETSMPGTEHREQILTELVNYRAVVATVQTWPVSVPFVLRFVFTVIVPPVVWILGAVTESLVEDLLH